MPEIAAKDARIAEVTAEIIALHHGREGPLLPILHGVQAAFGYVPDAALPIIAGALLLSRAEVQGVVSFYHDFKAAPQGKHVVRLCRAEACQAMGGEALASAVQARLGLDWHETSADQRVTLEPVFCLGLCACAPAAELDGRLLGRADAAQIEAMLTEIGA